MKILPLPISIASTVRYLIPLTCTNSLPFGLHVDVTIVNIIPKISFSANDIDDKFGNYLIEIKDFIVNIYRENILKTNLNRHRMFF